MPDFWSIVRMMGNKITNLGTPTAGTDAATKQYVDDHITDGVDAHDAASVSFDPTGLQIVAGTEVQTAIEELDDELDSHEVDTSDAHDAAAISVNPAGSLAASNVQTALEELATEADTDEQNLADHLADTSDAHNASAISNVPAGTIGSSDVQGAINELAGDAVIDAQNLANHLADTVDAHDASAISVAPVVEISSTDVQAAIAELASEKITLAEAQALFQSFKWKQPVKYATTVAGNLATDFENGDAIDSGVLFTGFRILIKDQADPKENGIYIVNASGPPTRATDFDTGSEIDTAAVLVEGGSVNADTGWLSTADSLVVIGSTPITFTQFPGMGALIAGLGLTRTGNTIDVGAGTGIVVSANDIELGSHDHDNATAGHGGILTNDAHDGFSEYAESPLPSNPAADKLRFWVRDVQNNTRTGFVYPSGRVYTNGFDLWFIGRNNSGITFPKGTVVTITGASIEVPTVSKADASSNSLNAHGIVAEDILTGTYGPIMVHGLLQNLDTSGLQVGDPFYLSATTPGAYRLTDPNFTNASAISQRLGVCTIVHGTTGAIFVNLFGSLVGAHEHGSNVNGFGGNSLYPNSFGTSSVVQVSLVGTNFHNWNPGGAWATDGFIIQVTGTTVNPTVITGLAAPTDSRRRLALLVNKGTMPLDLPDSDANSSVGNRWLVPAGALTFRLSPGQTIPILWMDNGGTNVWQILDALKTHTHVSDTTGGAIAQPGTGELQALAGTLGVPQTSNPYVTLLDHHDEGPITNGGFEQWVHQNPFSQPNLAVEYAKGWYPLQGGAGLITLNRDNVVPAVSATNQRPVVSLRSLVTTIDASITGSDFYTVVTEIEGWKWGAYDQRPFTLGFWVRASTTGIYSVALRNATGNRSCVMEYTINVANTYEYKTITFPANNGTGTWVYEDGISLYIFFSQGCGPTLAIAPGSWQSGNFVGSINQVSNMGTVNNTFYLWGVKGAQGNFVSPYKSPNEGHGSYGPVRMSNPYVTVLDPHEKGPILNGGMTVMQRPSPVAAVANAGYTLDMWQYTFAGAVVVDIYQDAVNPPALSNYGAHASPHSLLVDVTTADASIAAGDLCAIQQNIEGFTWAPYVCRQFTIGFWVKSTIIGTYCVAFRGGGLSYIGEYTIVTANTWEYKTITVPPTAAGTWLMTTGIGMTIDFVLMAGTTWQTTPNFWWGGTFMASANQVNAVNSNANFFSLWGVKVGLGPYVTPYIARSREEELMACYRYLYRITNPDAAYKAIITGQAYATTGARFAMPLPVPMRVPPVLSVSAVGDFVLSSAPYGVLATTGIAAAGGMGQHTDVVSWDGTVAAGLAGGGNATQFIINAAAGKWIQWSAEM